GGAGGEGGRDTARLQLIISSFSFHTRASLPRAGIIIHVVNSYILPRQNLSAPTSRKPEPPVSSPLISTSNHAVVMNPLYLFVCTRVCIRHSEAASQAKLCRVFHCVFMMTVSDAAPKQLELESTAYTHMVAQARTSRPTFSCYM
uniref:Uncharacterized protein n=1 Tax=Gasterosteus aculeatus aculeatus TaxID=481459 RepID=A0AAQ4QVI7_GASAC